MFLGYDPQKIESFRGFILNGYEVIHRNDKLINSACLDSIDLVISYGYRYLIPKSILDIAHMPILNLHISLLPFNRGAHPNFWSFYDGTPSGISIHLIDEGIDTGGLIAQEEIFIDSKTNTFKTSYDYLNARIQSLFVKTFPALISSDYEAFPQSGFFSQHLKDDLPKDFRGWNSNIFSEINRLKSMKND